MITHRQKQILDILKENKYEKISEIAKKIYVSEATARRDVAELKKLGLCERDHGGAMYVDINRDANIFVRREKDTKDKLMTANIAADKIPSFSSVFIDNSSSVLALCQMIKRKNIIAFTNGITIAVELCKNEEIQVMLPMGQLRSGSNSITGSQVTKWISDLRFDLFLGSCAAIDDSASYETSSEQAEIKKAAFRNSSIRILIVDKNKFLRSGTFKTSNLIEYDAIYTNADDETIKPLLKKGINVINK